MNSTNRSERTPSHDMATQAPELHIGAEESKQSADAEHVDPTAAVATMVLPTKETVKDIAAGSTAGAMDPHVPLNFPLKTGTAKACSFPCHAQKAGTTQRWCVTRCKLGEEPRRWHTPGQHIHDITVHLDGHIAVQIQLPLLTARHVLQLEPG